MSGHGAGYSETAAISEQAGTAGTGAQVRYLTVAGLNGSGDDHWQSRWERCQDRCTRIELGDWDAPDRNRWVARIDAAVERVSAPVVLVGHSLGCIAIAWWAAGAATTATAKIAAAMLVAPPDVGQQGCDIRLLRFAPLPDGRLPFRALVVASEDDQYSGLARSRAMANGWGADFVGIGRAGHINAASGLGDWARGQALLAALVAAR